MHLKVNLGSAGGSCGFGDDTSIDKLEANGATTVGDNFLFKDVKVNGAFTFSTNAKGENLEVNGACSSKGLLKLSEKIIVNGKLSGDRIEGNEIEIAGGLESTETKGQYILIKRESRVRGKIVGREVIVEDDARVDHIVADKVKLGDDVKVNKLESSNVDAEDSAKFNLV